MCQCHQSFLETTSLPDDNLQKSTQFIDGYLQYFYHKKRKEIIKCTETKHIFNVIHDVHNLFDIAHVRIKYIMEFFFVLPAKSVMLNLLLVPHIDKEESGK